MPISLKPSGIMFRLTAFLLVGGLIPIGLFWWLSSAYVEDALEQQLGLRLTVWLEARRNELSREILQEFISLRELSRDPSLRRTPEDAMGSFLKRRFEAVTIQGRSVYRCLAVLDSRGRAVGLRGDCTDLESRKRAWSWASRPPSWMSAAYFAQYDTPAVDLFFPFSVGDPHDNSGLWVTLDLGFVSTLLVQAGFVGGMKHDLLVYDGHGLMLGRRDPTRGFLANTAGAFPVLATASSEPGSYSLGYAGDGEQVIAADLPLIALIPELRQVETWRIAVIQPLTDPSESTVFLLQRLSGGLGLAVIITVICCLIFALLLLRSILVPVRALALAVERVQRGDLDTPIEVEGVEEFSQLGQFFDDMRRQLRKVLNQLTEMAVTDSLTGVANRRSFDDGLQSELKRALRYKEEVSVAVLDLDRFKNINDTFGHAFGDHVLREVANRCRSLCRETDLFARCGGDEFAFVLPHTGKEQAMVLMERVRRAVESLRIEDLPRGFSVRVTVSIGVAAFPGDAETAETLMVEADEALYRAKQGGRNRVGAA